jgi:hypothetical protein
MAGTAQATTPIDKDDTSADESHDPEKPGPVVSKLAGKDSFATGRVAEIQDMEIEDTDPEHLFGPFDEEGSIFIRSPEILMLKSKWNALSELDAALWREAADVDVVSDRFTECHEALIIDVVEDDLLIRRLAHRLREVAYDEEIEWHASAIRMLWSRKVRKVPERYERALQRLMSEHRNSRLYISANDKSKIDTVTGHATPMERNAQRIIDNSKHEQYVYDPLMGMRMVYGERNELPDQTTLRVKGKTADSSPTNLDDDTATEYIADAVPESPTEHVPRPKTRLRAKLDALVIPEPCMVCTDISSKTEETLESIPISLTHLV